MKTIIAIFKYSVAVIALIVAMAYALGYDYLFKGIAKTYLRGATSATIDDGPLFPSHVITAGDPKPWPLDAQFNKAKLPAALTENLAATQTAAFLIVKNGKLLYEKYGKNYTATSQTNSFSMAKAVTALLLGAAIDDRRIKSENQFFSDFYPDFSPNSFSKTLSLKDLVAMQSGLEWDENYHNPFSPNARAYYGNSLYDAVMNREIIKKPGQEFVYQSGNTQLLGFAVRKAVNMPLASFASKKLWNPLHMETDAYWTTDENSMEKTFCCVQANARDYARLGLLMLNHGKADGVQVISSQYIQKMITPTKASRGTYGYGIWTSYESPYPYYYFRGILGQYIIIVPSHQLVIVRTGNDQHIEMTSSGHPAQTRLLVKEVVEHF